jgi:uncharacterized membrane protein
VFAVRSAANELDLFALFIILSMINHIQAKKGVKSMMKGFMELTLGIYRKFSATEQQNSRDLYSCEQ